MGNTYGVTEVAQVLGVSWKTIIRRIESGEIRARKRRGLWRISSDNLKRWVLMRIGMLGTSRSCENIQIVGTKLVNMTGQTLHLNRLVYEEDDEIHRPLKGSSQEALPPVAVLELQNRFRGRAGRMAPKHPQLQEDLVQEMSLAVLSCRGLNTMSFYCARAEWRARDYLDCERQRGMKSLEDMKYEAAVPVREDETHILNLEQIRRLLRMAGIPESMLQAQFDISLFRAG